MRHLIVLFIIMPFVACSQVPDLGFWEDKQALPGCKTWSIRTYSSDPVLTITVYTVDCYGESKRIGLRADGTEYFICSIGEPDASSPLIQSITETVYDCEGNIVGVPCDSETNASGKDEFPAEFVSHIGTYTGTVYFHFATGDVPDKVVVEKMDGTVIYTTGWRGSTAYQSQLNAGLVARGLPTETIQGPAGDGGAEYSFNKDFPDTTVRFKVYTSYWISGGSSWWITVHCPE